MCKTSVGLLQTNSRNILYCFQTHYPFKNFQCSHWSISTFFRQNAILAYQSYLIVYNLNSNKIKKAALFLSLRVGEFHCLCYTSLLKPMYSELQSRFVFKSCSHAQKQGQLFRIPETTLSLVRALRNTLLHEYPNSFNYLAATIEDKSWSVFSVISVFERTWPGTIHLAERLHCNLAY